MPVNSTHPDYDAALPDWLRARDVLAGEDAVKAGGEKYLPRLDSQSDLEFLAYRKRAAFFNATARSAEGFVGLIFRRPPFVKVPEVRAGVAASGVGRALGVFVNDSDMLGSTLAGLTPASWLTPGSRLAHCRLPAFNTSFNAFPVGDSSPL
ncbi:MAG TPA: hypothetical protein VLT36_23870 [Candidatus Dormibacteraeota bacterium]|nr:hypothetical protein [Candidatus Dormibacteraeota bacterium]